MSGSLEFHHKNILCSYPTARATSERMRELKHVPDVSISSHHLDTFSQAVSSGTTFDLVILTCRAV